MTHRGFPSQTPIKKTKSKFFVGMTPFVFDEDTGKRIPIRSQQVGEAVGVAMVVVSWALIFVYLASLVF